MSDSLHSTPLRCSWTLRAAITGILLSQIASPANVSAKPEGRFVQAIAQSAAPSSGTAGQTESATAPPGIAAHLKPNIVVILLDDAGYAATSLFGGLAQTPALENLARTGLRYNSFHVAAICAPTRAALLSGRNPHQVGFGQIPELASKHPGYNSLWPKSAASIAQNLHDFGYATAAFGKWHNTPPWEWSPVGPFEHWPTGLGFEYFYGTIGTTDMWEPLLWRNTTEVQPSRTAEQGYNLTTDLVDDAVRWLHTRQTLAPQTPYFMYFATTATHSPHQVPKEWIDAYRGKFSAGWDALREGILARQKAQGIVPADAVLTPRENGLPAWNSLSPDEKIVAQRQMEILAGFMSQTDHEIGRLIEAIRNGPNGKDTLIFFIGGDNGASGDNGVRGCDDCLYCPPPPPAAKVRITYLDQLAGPMYLSESDAAWAFMNDTPFPGMKRDASTLGGTTDPLVVSWPGHTASSSSVRRQYLNVTDIAATIYDVLGYTPPPTVNGVEQIPLSGTSFAASFESPDVPSTHHIQYFESFGNRAIYRDGWMASRRYLTPWDLKPISEQSGRIMQTDGWQLYHLDADFSQAHDVSKQYPDKLREMVALFDTEGRKNNVYPIGRGQIYFAQMSSLTRHRTDFTYYPDLPPLVWDAIPDFSLAHRLTARVHVDDDHANGLIISDGMRGRGFALYMKEGRLIYEVERMYRTYPLQAAETLAAGEHVIVAEVAAAEYGSEGTHRVDLYVDGKPVAQGDLHESLEPFYGASTLSIGAQRDSPVSPSLPPPFSGTIHDIGVHMETAEESGRTPGMEDNAPASQ